MNNRDERGMTMIFMAISLVGLLGMSALALDLGQGYTSHRRMQNAADAAALAGSRQLLKTRNIVTGVFSDLTNAVYSTAQTTAVNNGAASSQFVCKVVRKDQSVIGDCSPSTNWVADAINGGPAGVKVTAAVTNSTAFGKVLNQPSLTARINSTALIEPLASAKGAPFLVCGVGDKTMSLTQWNKDTSVDPITGLTIQNNHDLTPQTIDLLLGTGAINPLAVGHIYGIQGSNAWISTCGSAGGTLESAFDGKSANGGTGIDLPSWQTGTNGNGNDAAIYDTVAGATACGGGVYTNCDLVLPVASQAKSGYQLYVVSLAVFHVSGNGTGNPKYAGRLLTATAPITRGEGSYGQNCPLGAACVVKLVN